jgi:ferredoxin
LAEAFVPHDAWRPRGTRGLAAALRSLDALFDRVYASRYNPLYRSGTLATLSLTIALVTGVYLLFVYEIGRPYESVLAIQRDALLGRWIRALHRYASDAAVVAVAVHVVRLLVQGKTWGPRTLAWITGLLLAGMLFLSGVTGFVLVWDEFGQKLAWAGARMLRLLPLFPEPPDRSFVGERPLPSQFFFMNLFLHVAVPLGMVAFLWLHTFKLARAAWFPERAVIAGAAGGLLALSVAWPAPLPRAGDLLAVPGRVATDWFYAFWLPLAERQPLAGLLVFTAAGALLCAVPWIVRPAARLRPPPASVDPDKCEGCRQCFLDCPFDAIDMVPGAHPEKYPLRASVRAEACVSCGLCAGSCASLAIGPDARTARDQLVAARAFVDARPAARAERLVVACRGNDEALDGAAVPFEVDCVGVLHPATVSFLASRFRDTVVVTCPRQNCVHREGATLAEARLVFERAPAVPGRLAALPLRLVRGSAAEWPALAGATGGAPAAPPRARAMGAALAVGFSALALAALAAGSRGPQGVDAEHAVLRLGWRLAGQVRQTCRDRSAEELARLPVHMRTPRECTSEVLAYALRATVDGRLVVARTVTPAGVRADRPLSVEEEVAIAPGEHVVAVTFVPANGAGAGRALAFGRALRFDARRVRLVTYDGETLVAR